MSDRCKTCMHNSAKKWFELPCYYCCARYGGYKPIRICKTCNWYTEEPIDHGYVCVNADSPNCAELWCREDDSCDEWERKDNE